MKDFIEILGWLKKERQFDVSPYISKKVKNVITSLKNRHIGIPCLLGGYAPYFFINEVLKSNA